MLHTLAHSPSQIDFPAFLRTIGGQDVVLLLQDGVLAGTRSNRYISALLALNVAVYAVDVDVLARGLAGYMAEQVELIDYQGFVALTEQQKQQVSW